MAAAASAAAATLSTTTATHAGTQGETTEFVLATVRLAAVLARRGFHEEVELGEDGLDVVQVVAAELGGLEAGGQELRSGHLGVVDVVGAEAGGEDIVEGLELGDLGDDVELELLHVLLGLEEAGDLVGQGVVESAQGIAEGSQAGLEGFWELLGEEWLKVERGYVRWSSTTTRSWPPVAGIFSVWSCMVESVCVECLEKEEIAE